MAEKERILVVDDEPSIRKYLGTLLEVDGYEVETVVSGQEAIKKIAPRSDAVLVIGSANSSNSMRLVEVARKAGVADAQLIDRAASIDWARLKGAQTVGLSAGASAPEVLVDEVIAAFRERYALTLEEVTVTREDVEFKLPRALAG